MYKFAEFDVEVYRQGLHRLSVELNKDSGQLILELFFMKPSRALVRYTKRWLADYPESSIAPKVLAIWIESYPSDDTKYFASRFLRQARLGIPLRLLISVILQTQLRSGLVKLIEERLEKEPNNFIWPICLCIDKKSKKIDSLKLKWIELNKHNPDAEVLEISAFTHSPVVIDSIVDWLLINGVNDKSTSMNLGSLLYITLEYHRAKFPTVLRVVRKWLAENPENDDTPRLYRSLLSLSYSGLSTDCRKANAWYLKHKSSHNAWKVLCGLLCADGIAPEIKNYAIYETKSYLNMGVSEKSPAIVRALLAACLDDESIALAKEAFAKSGRTVILTDLLFLAPSEELIEKAHDILPGIPDVYYFLSRFLIALLQVSPSNHYLKQRAKNWLKTNPKSKYAGELRKTLRNAERRQA